MSPAVVLLPLSRTVSVTVTLVPGTRILLSSWWVPPETLNSPCNLPLDMPTPGTLNLSSLPSPPTSLPTVVVFILQCFSEEPET
uniref:Uncharacterized protein n=1 Tax=Anguilla anguilla TaxID=7936 RepID=A0A0E9W3Z1_ANGAN